MYTAQLTAFAVRIAGTRLVSSRLMLCYYHSDVTKKAIIETNIRTLIVSVGESSSTRRVYFVEHGGASNSALWR